MIIEISEEAKKIIEGNPIAFATVDQENKPNVIAVAYAKVVDEGIIITDNYMHHTAENLRQNDQVCLAVWDNDWNGYKIIGKCEYYDNGKWVEFVRGLPENKGMPAKGALLVRISKLIELK